MLYKIGQFLIKYKQDVAVNSNYQIEKVVWDTMLENKEFLNDIIEQR